MVRNGVIIDAPGEFNLGRIDPAGQPGATPRPRRRLRDLCDPRLSSALQPHQIAPRHLVAPPRPHRPRQPPTRVRATSPEHPPRRLAPDPHPRPHPDHPIPRRNDHDHRPTHTTRRMRRQAAQRTLTRSTTNTRALTRAVIEGDRRSGLWCVPGSSSLRNPRGGTKYPAVASGHDCPGSFNGRTAVFGAVYRGSNPLPGTPRERDYTTSAPQRDRTNA